MCYMAASDNNSDDITGAATAHEKTKMLESNLYFISTMVYFDNSI